MATTIIISIIGLIAVPTDLVISAHLITAAVSSELNAQRGEVSDNFRTVLWFIVWIAVTVIIAASIGIVATL